METKQPTKTERSPKMHLLQNLSYFQSQVQQYLFPSMEETLDPLLDSHKKVLLAIETVKVERFLSYFHYRGRPPHSRVRLANTFIAKAVLNISTNEELHERLIIDKGLRRICGWETIKGIPSLSTFSRAFTEFTEIGLPQKIHKMLIDGIYSGEVTGHLSRDATDITERAGHIKSKKNYTRTKFGGAPHQEKPTRCERQASGKMTLEEMIEELPKERNIGRKASSKGRIFHWVGYKLHVDVTDDMIPISCIMSSASLHDSQAAIPLSLMSEQRVFSFYELMDKAYDTKAIKGFMESSGKKAIISTCPRGKGKKEEYVRELRAKSHLKIKYSEDIRFKHRTVAERFFSNLKENHLGRIIWVKGHAKVLCHIMFGIVALTVKQLYNMLN